MDYEKLKTAMANLEEDTVLACMEEVMSEGGGDAVKAMDACQAGMDQVGTRFEEGGLEVVDLGIDVSPERIVQAARDEGIDIIALSGVLTLALYSMRQTVDAFVEAGLRENVRILIGGNPVSETACKSIGADEWAHSPQKSVQYCREWATVTV